MLLPSGSMTKEARLGVAQPRRTVVLAACLQSRGMKGIDLRAAVGGKGGMLLRAMRMKAIDPEDRKGMAIGDAVRTLAVWHLHDAPHPQRAEHGIIKSG
jgi:hypothetical protein